VFCIFGWDGLEGTFIVKGGASLNRKHVHPDGGLPDSPEPVAPGKAGFGEECAGHFHGRVPVALHSPILGLPMWRRGTNTDAVRLEETTNGAGEEAPIEVVVKALGESAGVDEEAPEGVNNGIARNIRKAIGLGVADGKINQEKAILVRSLLGSCHRRSRYQCLPVLCVEHEGDE
jgi:hypothetical protein